MTRYVLTEESTGEQRDVLAEDAEGHEAIAVPCPWHVDEHPSCICNDVYRDFWCATCERRGTAVWIEGRAG